MSDAPDTKATTPTAIAIQAFAAGQNNSVEVLYILADTGKVYRTERGTQHFNLDAQGWEEIALPQPPSQQVAADAKEMDHA